MPQVWLSPELTDVQPVAEAAGDARPSKTVAASVRAATIMRPLRRWLVVMLLTLVSNRRSVPR
jgi:hypothetical protein